jgi:hypothetical protein
VIVLGKWTLQQASSVVNNKLKKTHITLEPGNSGGPENLKLIQPGEEYERHLHQL